MAKLRMFVSKNLVTIVMVPSLIGLHYAWDSLQRNKALVSEEERKDLPIIIAAKALWKRVAGEQDASQD
ncbi:AGAP000096-PA-like protein [Anopheles sinensis]|uniref:AGAP000096-PA-like protein n=1 Tax=Anopheles sinensis TaxID=74873 RepID=A0A084VIY7_ANOSI|nr:AGAP000096-PA-like protein [Anopheles sinensis]